MKKVYQDQLKKARQLLDKGEVKIDKGTVTIQLPVDLAEVMDTAQETVTDLAHRIGLLLIKATMNEEVKRLVGPRYHPAETSPFTRWGEQPGYVLWAGKKVRQKRPRLRTKDGSREVPLVSYQTFQSERGRDARIWQNLVLGLSCRDYQKALDNFYEGYGLTKSSISQHFIKASQKKLEALMERRLEGLNLVAIGIDGLEVAGAVLIIAVGIDDKGKKHILGLWQGATENTEVCKNLVEDMVRRGLNPDKRYLFVIDGSKALSKTIKGAFGESALIQRCQLHKRRNLKQHLPDKYQRIVDQRLRVAYHMSNYQEAKACLLKTVEYVKGINPTAARSLEEGLEETLTVHRLGLPDILRKTLSTTNFIESPLAITRDVIRDVKRWRQGDQRLRWVASALLEAEQRMHRIRGYRALSILINELNTFNKNLDQFSRRA